MIDRYDEYSASIEEIHHTEKKDAPSGTAITLAEDLIYESQRYEQWVPDSEAEANELPVHSLREPNVPGTHEITWKSDIDMIQIRHTAFNRKGFALGAVLAAEWLRGKSGVYTMRHLLELES